MVRNRNWQLKFGKAKRLPKLFEQINQDLKRAMKAKEGLTTSVLSRLIAAAVILVIGTFLFAESRQNLENWRNS